MTRRTLAAALTMMAIAIVARASTVTEQAASGPDVFVSESSVGEVRFPHRAHFEDLEIDCRECHHETDARVLDIPHREYFQDFWIDCTTCHHASDTPRVPTSCSTCHVRRAGNADETLSSKVVIHASCWRCHEVGTGRDASAGCGQCHVGGDGGR